MAGWNPLLVFGQTALSFCLLHAHLLEFGASVLGVSHRLGLTATFIASIIVAVLSSLPVVSNMNQPVSKGGLSTSEVENNGRQKKNSISLRGSRRSVIAILAGRTAEDR
jgi:hypothetical protein